MRIEFIGRNYDVSEKLKDFTEKKLEKLNKYFLDDEAKVKATFKKEARISKTEIMLDYHGNFIRAEVVSENFYENIDKLLPKIEGQIRKYRTKWDQHQKNNAYKEDSVFEGVEDNSNRKVVKDKQFKMKPMTIEEAQEQMEMLGHSFFVYIDAKTEQVNVLYLRNDGELGLIETQV